MGDSPSAAARSRLALVVRTAGEDWGEDEELLKSGLPCGGVAADVDVCVLLPAPTIRSGDSKFLRRLEGDAAVGVVAAGVDAVTAVNAVALSTINGVARGGMGVA